MVSIDSIRTPILADLEAFDEFVRDHFSSDGRLMSEMIAQDIVQTLGQGALVAGGSIGMQANPAANGEKPAEDTRTGNARARAAQASQPA